MIKLMLLQIGLASEGVEDSSLPQLNTPDRELGFVWDPYSPDCSTKERSFPLSPVHSDTAVNASVRSPVLQSSVPTLATYSSINQSHAPSAAKVRPLFIAVPLPPTEEPRSIDQYVNFLPNGMF